MKGDDEICWYLLPYGTICAKDAVKKLWKIRPEVQMIPLCQAHYESVMKEYPGEFSEKGV